MNAPLSPIILLDAVRREQDKRRAESSLAEFVKQAWHVLEPSAELKWGWATDAICEHLMAVTDGDIKRLLMNVPPGSMKSLLTGVFWPAWEWGPQHLAGMRYLSTAHKQDLAVRDNLKCRRLITSEWYQARWPVRLVGDQNAKTKFENDSTGFREAMAFTSMTGSRGDRVILDDPLSVDDARSEAALAAAEATFREALPTRVNDHDESAIVVIMQRLHVKDTSGIILAEDLGYEHLCLPMRYEKARACHTSIGFSDPRKEEGELMFPERFSELSVRLLEKTLGSYGTAGQLQQSPSPAGGGILKVEHFKLWPWQTPVPVMEFVVQSYDGAFTKDHDNDPCGHLTMGVAQVGSRYCGFILDVWEDWMEYPAFRQKVIDDWKGATYGGQRGNKLNKPRKADVVLIEEKANGLSLLQDLREGNVPVAGYNPGRADKKARAHVAAPVLELDCLYILESKKEPGKPVTWARSFLERCKKFPNDEHDDVVDCFTQAVIYLKDAGWFDLSFAEPDEVEERDYHADRRARQNPYSQ